MSKNRQLKVDLMGVQEPCTNVTSAEYEQIKKDSEASGQSIPDLLRESYFKSAAKKSAC